MNNYIVIDGKNYYVLARDYLHTLAPSKVVRDGVLGNDIVTIGPGVPKRIVQMILRVPYTPTEGVGGLTDLVIALEKAVVSYTDHETTGDGSGTFDITLLAMKRVYTNNSPRPEPGYHVAIEWQAVRAVPT